ncbi:Alpha/Beta hydrolase protein [Chytriomyces sp. MP71]|nr:Alpha/Beta hydrolase protein [Chytriomyces sp. MP71]
MTFEVLCLVLVLLFLWHYLVVPTDSFSLGSLSTATNAAQRELVSRVYPAPAKESMASLSQGITHFFIRGPKHGKRLVLVHGISVTGDIFPQVIQQLNDKGFLVLSYDLYGHGHSDSPGIPYTAEAFAIQLRDILDHVNWPRAILLGFSLGGVIALQFADVYPARVDKLVLVAPAGLKKAIPAAGRVFEIPTIGEMLFYTLGKRVLTARSRKHEKGLLVEPFKSQFVAHQQLNINVNPGFLRTYYKVIRYGPIRFMESLYESVAAKFGGRVLCIWGRQDTTAPFEAESTAFRALMPEAKFLAFEGRHTVLAERSDVIDCIDKFC